MKYSGRALASKSGGREFESDWVLVFSHLFLSLSLSGASFTRSLVEVQLHRFSRKIGCLAGVKKA